MIVAPVLHIEGVSLQAVWDGEDLAIVLSRLTHQTIVAALVPQFLAFFDDDLIVAGGLQQEVDLACSRSDYATKV